MNAFEAGFMVGMEKAAINASGVSRGLKNALGGMFDEKNLRQGVDIIGDGIKGFGRGAGNAADNLGRRLLRSSGPGFLGTAKKYLGAGMRGAGNVMKNHSTLTGLGALGLGTGAATGLSSYLGSRMGDTKHPMLYGTMVGGIPGMMAARGAADARQG